jgi:phosphatidylglycerol:prolipoprotein diacylglycerol transferase
MYPELFRIPGIGYSISSFGVMLALAFLVGFAITRRRMEEVDGIEPEFASTVLVYAIVGGLLGSKLYFTIDNWLQGTGPLAALFFSRAGFTWYGGLMGGCLAGVVACRVHGVRVFALASAAAPGLAVSQAIGRVGCFLAGDDYGRVTDLPWGVAFPHGAPPTIQPVHPTQLYEVAWLLPVAAFLWLRRRKSPFLFGEYVAANGAGRVVIESWRVNPKVAFGLTEPQWIGLALIVLGLAGWVYYARRPSPSAA